MKTLKTAQMDELCQCYEIINAGKRFQREQGFVQWTDDYPNIDTIKDDIERKKGYIVKIGDKIAAYMCIDFEGEPAYDHIRGGWQTTNPYADVHRMAFDAAFRGMGLTESVFCLIEDLCRSRGVKGIRADTDFSNERMQHILEKNGFLKCGTIVFQGDDRLAYEKTVSGSLGAV